MHRSRKLNDLFSLAAMLAALVLVNIIFSSYFFRLDLTADKRYTIMPATKKLLKELPGTVFVDVYLEGEFPAGFERLQRSIRETLEEFRAYAGDKVQYRFTDPSAASDPRQRQEGYEALVKRGLTPTNLYDTEGGAKTEKIIFPGAIVQYGGKEQGVVLLKGNQAAGAQERLNQSVEGVEFELAQAIKTLSQKRRPKIAIIKGHGESTGAELNDLGASLKTLYDLEPVDLPKKASLEGYDAALIIKPDSAFSEPDKYKLDQLLISGGKLLFFIDEFKARLDSIKPAGSLLLPQQLNLEDMLFRYGARVNADMVMDMNSAAIPMVVGISGDKPQTAAVPWRFYPIVNTFGPHPIVKNMNSLLMKFASSIDTVKAPGIRKTILASTGQYSRLVPAPVRMSFNEARIQPTPEMYGKSHLPVAVLLEGRFQSLYTNRLAPQTQATFAFKERGDKPGAVLVVSDGDLPLNEVNEAKRTVYPLGYDRMSGINFGQKDFIVNTLAYLLDDDGLILARNKEIVLRPLDKPRVEKERATWQAANLVFPLILLGVFGAVRLVVRRRRYAK